MFNQLLWSVGAMGYFINIVILAAELSIFSVNLSCHSVLHVPRAWILGDKIKSFIFNNWPQFAIGFSGQWLPDNANYNLDESMTLSNKSFSIR